MIVEVRDLRAGQGAQQPRADLHPARLAVDLQGQVEYRRAGGRRGARLTSANR
jgi:hypothetical protein